VVIEDGRQQVPDIPVGLAPDTLNRSRCGKSEEVDENLGHEHGGTLDPASVARLLAVAREIGLVDEHGRQGAHDDVDACHDGPAERLLDFAGSR
jgi:hypothetical protein